MGEKPTSIGRLQTAYWLWRVGAGAPWEVVKVTQNSEGDLWCWFFDLLSKVYIGGVSGEWGNRIEMPGDTNEN